MRFIWFLFKRLFLLSILLLGVAVVGTYYYMEFVLEDIDALNTVQLQVPLQIFTHDGKLIAEYGEKRRNPIPYDQIPKQLIDAVLATEDQRYFQHPGIDIPGLMRAAIKLAITGKKREGGSTITMQVARSFYLKPQKTFGRKIREILLALKIDHKLSKQKILELYLNKILFGNRAYGVAAAADVYYGKPLKDLTLAQYAMLAGIPKAPSTLNPLANAEAAKKRRDHVLGRMFELHYIDEKAYNEAIKEPLNAQYHKQKVEIRAPYAAELVRQQLEQMYGDSIYTEGFYVYTTIDSTLQNYANDAVRDGLLAYDQRHGYRGAEQNLGTPNLEDLEDWENDLNDMPSVNGLEPAAVVDMSERSIVVLRGNGMMVTIQWPGLSWARKQVNADYLGPMPKKASDIVKLGDVIRIASTVKGWRLTQVPKAEAGLVTLNPQNGAILNLIGGFDFQDSNFNRITNAERQPGSSFKPFIFSAALEKGFTLATVINDAPIVVENPTDNSLWRPQNDEREFFGPTRLREALIHSRNLIAIRLLDMIGLNYTIDYAKRFGFARAQLPQGLSLALGTALVTPLQMATGYSVFANGGFKVVPFIIDSIRNTGGKVIYQAKPLLACDKNCPANLEENMRAPRAISEQNAFLITSALHDVTQYGTAHAARSLQRKDIAGKTGTTQNQVDAWFAGFNRDLVSVSWVGFDENQQSLHEYGNQAALPIWIQFMEYALKDKPDRPLEQPPGVVSVRIDPLTGKRALAEEPTAQFEFFMKPFVPEEDKVSVVQQDNEKVPVAPASESTTEELF